MEEATSSEGDKAQSCPARRGLKRRRLHSSEPNLSKRGGGGGGGKGGGGSSKGGAGRGRGGGGWKGRRLHTRQSISSKKVANHVMRIRIRGSESDPLNLEGVGEGPEGDECSTCAPSPAPREGGQPSPLPPHLLRDPLNLEGRVWDHRPPGRAGERHGGGHHQKKRSRRRTVSHTEEEGGGGRGRGGGERKGGLEQGAGSSRGAFHLPSFKPQDTRYCYGNYDMYYGYRNRGVAQGLVDPRLALLKREWFERKDCLDIGSNTGQITLAIAQQFKPSRIVGVDIDSKLVRIANKNLFRHHVPHVAPDGRAFPSSFTLRSSFPLITKSPGHTSHSPQSFPHNVEFFQGNYVPESEVGVASTAPEYDVILALSITKWVHLNWGDAGIRRMFRKIYSHLRPGGRLVLEPQPFASYARKKKLTPGIYKNYYAIEFLPDQFHRYLMSPEVGFSSHRSLGVPHHKSEGFRRPLHVYIKGERGGKGGRGRKERDGGGGEWEKAEGGGCGMEIGTEERKERKRGEEEEVVEGKEEEKGEKDEGGGNGMEIGTEERKERKRAEEEVVEKVEEVKEEEEGVKDEGDGCGTEMGTEERKERKRAEEEVVEEGKEGKEEGEKAEEGGSGMEMGTEEMKERKREEEEVEEEEGEKGEKAEEGGSGMEMGTEERKREEEEVVEEGKEEEGGSGMEMGTEEMKERKRAEEEVVEEEGMKQSCKQNDCVERPSWE